MLAKVANFGKVTNTPTYVKNKKWFIHFRKLGILFHNRDDTKGFIKFFVLTWFVLVKRQNKLMHMM